MVKYIRCLLKAGCVGLDMSGIGLSEGRKNFEMRGIIYELRPEYYDKYVFSSPAFSK